jgi:hypothetical protein
MWSEVGTGSHNHLITTAKIPSYLYFLLNMAATHNTHTHTHKHTHTHTTPAYAYFYYRPHTIIK